MNTYDTFTSNPDHVQLVGKDLELFHSRHGDCSKPNACKTCDFSNRSTYCTLSITNPDNQPILDYFQLHYPEKLL